MNQTIKNGKGQTVVYNTTGPAQTSALPRSARVMQRVRPEEIKYVYRDVKKDDCLSPVTETHSVHSDDPRIYMHRARSAPVFVMDDVDDRGAVTDDGGEGVAAAKPKKKRRRSCCPDLRQLWYRGEVSGGQ